MEAGVELVGIGANDEDTDMRADYGFWVVWRMPEEAADAYRRFIMAWEDADPELQERVKAARKRLQKLPSPERSGQ